MKRRNYREIWKVEGVTEEELENHYAYKNAKSKIYRERNKEVREKNKSKIEEIKQILKGTDYKLVSVTNDGRGVFIGTRKKDSPLFGKNNHNTFIDWEYMGADGYCYIDYIKNILH